MLINHIDIIASFFSIWTDQSYNDFVKKFNETKKQHSLQQLKSHLQCTSPITDIQANLFLTGDSSNHQLVISFQSTKSEKDWKANQNIKMKDLGDKIKVHTGFYEQQISIHNQIKSQINEHKSKQNKIIVTGFSQGGALSQICGQFINEIVGKEIQLRTFSSPRVGNRFFIEYLNNKIPNSKMFYYGKDPVPFLLNLPEQSELPNIYHIDSESDKITIQSNKKECQCFCSAICGFYCGNKNWEYHNLETINSYFLKYLEII